MKNGEMAKNEEISNYVEENNKKNLYIYQSMKKLLGQAFNTNDFQDGDEK